MKQFDVVIENEYQEVLCTEEVLANGKRVAFAYRDDGGPIFCWDTDSLPRKWLEHPVWHPARVAIGTWRRHKEPSESFPALQVSKGKDIESHEKILASWLAKTYEYLSPLIGFHSCIFSSLRLFREQVLAQLSGIKENANILEVGGIENIQSLCGVKHCRGWAIDPAFSVSDVHNLTGRVEKKKGIVESLPFPDAFFDTIICLFVLEHLINPNMALREMSRVLKDDGMLLLGIPVAQNLIGRPPLFHRWCFVTDAFEKSGRFLPLSSIIAGMPEFFTPDSTTWPLVAQEGDACLFKIRKAFHG